MFIDRKRRLMRGLRFYAAMRRAEKRRAVNTEKRGLEAMMKEDFFLQETCEIMSGLFNVVITIVDKDFTRIAGTDHYKAQVGKPAANPNVFKEVMENEKTIIIDKPGEEAVCILCRNRAECREKAAIYTPLKVNDEIGGVLESLLLPKSRKRARSLKMKPSADFQKSWRN